MPVKHWFANFELNADAYGLNEKQKYVQARAKMTKTARLFLESAAVYEYGAMRVMLEDEFDKSKVCSADVHAELRERKKLRHESFHEYVLQMKRVAARSNIDTHSVIRYIVGGLQLKDEFKYNLGSCKSYKELQDQYEVYERVVREKFNKVDKVSMQVNEKRSHNANEKKMHCFNCGATDHLRKNFQADTKCFRCNKSGHMSKHCPTVAASVNLVQNAKP